MPEQIVCNRAHDETVEQRHRAAGSSARQNAPGGQETVAAQRHRKTVSAHSSRVSGLFRLRQGCGDPAPGVLDGVSSTVPSARLKRYFMSQISSEMALRGMVVSDRIETTRVSVIEGGQYRGVWVGRQCSCYVHG